MFLKILAIFKRILYLRYRLTRKSFSGGACEKGKRLQGKAG